MRFLRFTYWDGWRKLQIGVLRTAESEQRAGKVETCEGTNAGLGWAHRLKAVPPRQDGRFWLRTRGEDERRKGEMPGFRHGGRTNRESPPLQLIVGYGLSGDYI
jgi:hypothetical protein